MTQAANLAALGTNVNTSGIAQAAGGGTAGTNGAIGFKNRLINGNMVIDQRSAGASTTPTSSGYYSCDRWYEEFGAASKFSVQQNAGSVTPPAGFSNYIGITSLSAYSLSAGDYFYLSQNIEGYNIVDIGWGTANSQSVTISFWVRSSLTGTFSVSLECAGNNQSYPATYTVNSANTWEYKTITIPPTSSGTWNTNNTIGVKVRWNLGTGSTLSGTANSWSSSRSLAATGAVSVVSTNAATFYITGVQLEVGSAATNFDVRSIGTELVLCCRYYQNIVGIIGAGGAGSIFSNQEFPVQMRASPTVGVTGPINFTYAGVNNFVQSSANITGVGTFSNHQVFVSFGNFSGITNGVIYLINVNTNYMTLSAEL